jgi:hypothetical protein
MTRYTVQTRAIVCRHYYVEAANEKEAELLSCDMTPDYEEDDNEETMSIIETPIKELQP